MFALGSVTPVGLVLDGPFPGKPLAGDFSPCGDRDAEPRAGCDPGAVTFSPCRESCQVQPQPVLHLLGHRCDLHPELRVR